MKKFRVYDTLQKRYVTDDANWIITIDGKLAIMNASLSRYDFVKELCTGICDSKGVYIYEGDIVKEGIVKNHLGSWYIEPKGKDYAEPMIRYNYEYEIIGNIHN